MGTSRTQKRIRLGVYAEKIGMTLLYDTAAARIPVTVYKLNETVVVGRISGLNNVDKLQLATVDVSAKKVAKPQLVAYNKVDVTPKRFIREFKISADQAFEVGSKIDVRHFVKGQLVDVTGHTIGKGFAGVMKRHNFRGLEASHGVSVSHRSHGSTGQRQDPGRVFKNKKMAGHMGDVQVTVQNLEVVAVDAERQLLFVKGSAPGAKGAFVRICDAVKSAVHAAAPYPTFVESSAAVDTVSEG
jgi:large subunit ribosomal protein L3